MAGIIAGSGFESLTVTNASGSVMPAVDFQFRGLAPAAQVFAIAANPDPGPASDTRPFSEARPAFAEAMNTVAQLCDWTRIELLRPFILNTKADIVKKGSELGVNFMQTWSCYKGGEIHCGTCGTCVERREAFLHAGLPDPTEYAVTGPLPSP